MDKELLYSLNFYNKNYKSACELTGLIQNSKSGDLLHAIEIASELGKFKNTMYSPVFTEKLINLSKKLSIKKGYNKKKHGKYCVLKGLFDLINFDDNYTDYIMFIKEEYMRNVDKKNNKQSK